MNVTLEARIFPSRAMMATSGLITQPPARRCIGPQPEGAAPSSRRSVPTGNLRRRWRRLSQLDEDVLEARATDLDPEHAPAARQGADQVEHRRLGFLERE